MQRSYGSMGSIQRVLVSLLGLAVLTGAVPTHADEFVWDGTCGTTGWHAICTGEQCSSNPVRNWTSNNWGLTACGSDPGPAFPGSTDTVLLTGDDVLLSNAATIAYLTVPMGCEFAASGLPAVLIPTGGLTNGGTFIVRDGAALALGNCVVSNAGELILRYGGMWGAGWLHCDASTALDGPGTLTLESGVIDGGGTLTNNAGHVIHGGGSNIAVALANAGLLSADVVGNPLRLSTAAKTNTGTLQAVNGAILRIEVPVTQSSTGVIRADGTNSKVSLINGSAITGGMLNTSADGRIDADNVTTAFTDLVNLGDCHIWNGSTLNVTGTTLTNDGALRVYYGGYAGCGHLRFNSDLTLNGSGEIHLDCGDIDTASGITITNSAGHTIYGGNGSIPAAVSNDGLVAAYTTGYVLTLNGKTKTNQGVLQAMNGGYLDISTAIMQTAGGEIRAEGNGRVRLRNGAVVTGGALTVADGSLCTCGGGETATLGDLTMTGTASFGDGGRLIVTGTTLTNNGTIGINYGGMYGGGHVRFDSNATFGGTGDVIIESGDVATSAGIRFTNGAGHTFRGRGPLNVAMLNEGAIIADMANQTLSINPQELGVTNAGRLEAQPTCTLAINSASLCTQTAGETVANGTVAVHGAPLNLQGGSLRGSGVVAGSVANAGATVAPGTSAGTLTIGGNYTQAGGGTLEIELGGTTSGTEYDRLAVSSTATLAGTLRITTINGFQPVTGQEFVILTAGTRTGTFESVDGPLHCTVVYGAQDVRVVVLAPCVGDMNCDGQVDFADINAFVLYLSNQPAWQSAYASCDPRNGDINGDGVYPSFGDINPFVTLLTTNPLPIACP